jgi:putative transposase
MAMTMARPLRIQYEGAVYHVMNRGTARQPSFIRAADYQAFLDLLADAHRIWGIEVFGL